MLKNSFKAANSTFYVQSIGKGTARGRQVQNFANGHLITYQHYITPFKIQKEHFRLLACSLSRRAAYFQVRCWQLQNG